MRAQMVRCSFRAAEVCRVVTPGVGQRELLRCELPRWLLRPPLRIG
jgi:hypothetical protein